MPLSPHWRLTPNGVGVRLNPHRANGIGSKGRKCTFEIVGQVRDQSPATIERGTATCPYSDCRRVIDGTEVKKQAQSGDMGEQLYAVVYKKRVRTTLKNGERGKDKWERGYRAPQPEDDNQPTILERLVEKLPEWEDRNVIPSESVPKGHKTIEAHRYGMTLWRDMFSPRQLLCHGYSVELFQKMVEDDRIQGNLTDMRRAAYGYLALSIDRLISYNCRMTTWHAGREVIGPKFERHDYGFKWSYSEMSPLVAGLGNDWTIKQTAKCVNELVAYFHPDTITDCSDRIPGIVTFDASKPQVTITCKSGDSLDHIEDSSVDAVVIDPPYYDNVMYAELADFVYVWLKRTGGLVFPELFRRNLTDKESEAVANPAQHQSTENATAKELAGKAYQERMSSIFTECKRVLKADGILILMFTHKATGAWDAIATGLMDAGFTITATWPINTEAAASLHIRNKAAAKSTIFIVCRKRQNKKSNDEHIFWEDIERKVGEAVRRRIDEFQEAGIGGVDLYLSTFGPALEEFSNHWPIRRGKPREKPKKHRNKLQFENNWDPYAVTPEDALNAARREVKNWRLEKIIDLQADFNLDATTAFFVLAWDTFKAPVFEFDEALCLARAVGVNLERDVLKRMAGKKGGSNIVLWSSSVRAAKAALGHVDGSRGMIDALHHAANVARIQSLQAASDMLTEYELDQDSAFTAALKAVLEVLPLPRSITNVKLEGEVNQSADDFEVLYNLSQFALKKKVPEPKQMKFWKDNEP